MPEKPEMDASPKPMPAKPTRTSTAAKGAGRSSGGARVHKAKAVTVAPSAERPAGELPAKPQWVEPQAPVSSATPKSPPVAAPSAPSVCFCLSAPQASQVWLCGEFNKWAPGATPMTKLEGGRWEARLELSAGRYEYKFVVDGEWIADPGSAGAVVNEFGTLNSVIEVRGG